MKKLIHSYEIDHKLITAYHPAADDQVKRKNKNVSNILKKYLVGATQQWKKYLSQVQLALNTHIHARTGSTPFSLMFVRSFNEFNDFIKIKPGEQIDLYMKKLLNNIQNHSENIIPVIYQHSHLLKNNNSKHLKNQEK